MPMYPAMMEEDAPPKKKPAVAIAVGVTEKMKPMTFKPPKGWATDTDDEVKEALLKFKEMPDGTCEMISLDGAPFKPDGKMDMDKEEMSPDDQSQDMDAKDDEMPADMPMEDAITTLQKRDQKRY